MVTVNKMVMEAGLRFPLPLAVSYLLNAWNLAPLQLTSNSWVQIVCTFTLFGGHRLYRHPSLLEMNYLFKLTKQRDTIGGYHTQGRHGKVMLEVPNKFRGDPSKWFWVGGAWKSAAIDSPTMEIDIPTGFWERNLSSIVPSASELAFDFAIVSERIQSLPESKKDAYNINAEAHWRSARFFHFPRHLGISEEQQLNIRKRRRSAGPSVPASVVKPIAAVPISEHPPLPEELSAPSAAYLEAMTVARTETSRGRLFFGRDTEKVTRVRRTNPDCSPMVVDLLVSNLPRKACDVSHYVNWALHNLSRAWTTDLDEVDRRRSPDVAQALFALSLQMATMAAQVAS
ncbi:hypothetical protein OROHE_008697 [Orobanche hederae]